MLPSEEPREWMCEESLCEVKIACCYNKSWVLLLLLTLLESFVMEWEIIWLIVLIWRESKLLLGFDSIPSHLARMEGGKGWFVVLSPIPGQPPTATGHGGKHELVRGFGSQRQFIFYLFLINFFLDEHNESWCWAINKYSIAISMALGKNGARSCKHLAQTFGSFKFTTWASFFWIELGRISSHPYNNWYGL